MRGGPSPRRLRAYDGLDRLTQEVTPQGQIDYTYDNASRRTSMTVAGQTAVTYTYDNANRLTTITRGPSTVTLAYDDAMARGSLPDFAPRISTISRKGIDFAHIKCPPSA